MNYNRPSYNYAVIMYYKNEPAYCLSLHNLKSHAQKSKSQVKRRKDYSTELISLNGKKFKQDSQLIQEVLIYQRTEAFDALEEYLERNLDFTTSSLLLQAIKSQGNTISLGELLDLSLNQIKYLISAKENISMSLHTSTWSYELKGVWISSKGIERNLRATNLGKVHSV